MSTRLTLGSIKRKGYKNRFVGRIREKKQFSGSIVKTLELGNNPYEGDLLYPHIFLIVGVGGMGKTTLTNEFLSISNENGAYSVYIDAENYQFNDEETILRVIHDKIIENIGSRAEKALKNYRDAIIERSEVKQKAESAKADYEAFVNISAKAISLASPMSPIVEEGIKILAHAGAAKISDVEERIINWMHKRGRITDREYQMVKTPYLIAEEFMKGLGSIAGDKALVIALDTYELLDKYDSWMRRILEYSGERVIWIISGRENEKFLRYYRDSFAEELLSEIRINQFSQEDIIEYLKIQGVLPEAELHTSSFVQAIQDISQGVPLAVEVLTNLHHAGADIIDLFQDISNQNTARKEVIQRLTERFLKWCDAYSAVSDSEEITRSEHKKWIEGLAILGRYDRNVLEVLLKTLYTDKKVSSDDLLLDLGTKYSFIFGNDYNEMHDLVREVLREHLQSAPPTFWLTNFAKISLEYYSKTRSAREAELDNDPENFLGDNLWQDLTLSLLNTSYWSDRRGSLLTQHFTSIAIEAAFFASDFFHQCLNVISEFSVSDKVYSSTLQLWLNGGKDLYLSFSPDEKAVALWDKLRRNLQKQKISDNSKAIILTKWGDILYSKGKLIQSIDFYEQAANCNLNSQTLKNEIAESLRRSSWDICVQNQFTSISQEVLSAAEHATHLNENSDEAWNVYSVALYGRQNYEDSLNAIHRALLIEPNASMYYNTLGNVYLAISQFEDAIYAYETAIEKDNSNSYPYLGLSQVYLRQSQIEKAFSVFSRAVRADIKSDEIHLGMGDIYLFMGKHEEALSEYNKALEQNKENATIYNSMGNFYMTKRKYHQSMEYYKKSIEINPDLIFPYLSIGNIHFFEKRRKFALNYFQRALNINPEFTQTHISMGNIFCVEGEFDKALTYYTKAIELTPNSVEAHIGILGIYHFLKDTKKMEEQDVIIKSHINSETPDNIYNLACLHSLMGRLDDALIFLEKSLQFFPQLYDWALQDIHLMPLYEHVRFKELLVSKNQ